MKFSHSLTHPICRGVIPTEQELDRATGEPYPMAGRLLKAEKYAKGQQWCLSKDKGRAYVHTTIIQEYPDAYRVFSESSRDLMSLILQYPF